MKKLLLFALVVPLMLAFAGCQTDISKDVSNCFSDTELTIQATMELPLTETKTTCDDALNVYWTPDDAISLFYGLEGENGGSKFTSTITEPSLRSAFTGTIGAVTGVGDVPAEDLMFWGLYPYDATSSFDGQSVMVTMLSQQTGMADSFAPGMAPTLGRAPGLLLSFKNIYTGLYVTVTEAGYQSVTLRTRGGEQIAGRAKVGWVDGAPKVLDFVSGQTTNEVTLTAPTSAGFEPGKKYYILFYPVSMSTGFTVEIKSATKIGTFTNSNNLTLQRNKIYSVVNIDKDSRTSWTNVSNTESIQGGSNPDITW